MIDDLVKALLAKQPRFWGVTITFVVVCASLGPSLMGLWEKWTDARSGKKDLEKERQRLEIMMLQLQIEQLRRQLHPDVAPPGESAVAGHAVEPARERAPQPPKVPAMAKHWKWLDALKARNPALARLVLGFLLGAGWSVFGFFLLMVIYSLCVIAFPQKDLSSSDAAQSLILFVPAAGLFAYAVRLLRAKKRQLAGS
jgi:hypothetical protein